MRFITIPFCKEYHGSAVTLLVAKCYLETQGKPLGLPWGKCQSLNPALRRSSLVMVSQRTATANKEAMPKRASTIITVSIVTFQKETATVLLWHSLGNSLGESHPVGWVLQSCHPIKSPDLSRSLRCEVDLTRDLPAVLGLQSEVVRLLLRGDLALGLRLGLALALHGLGGGDGDLLLEQGDDSGECRSHILVGHRLFLSEH